MARKTAMDKFEEAMRGILSDYGEEIGAHFAAVTAEMGKKGAQALRRQSKEKLKQHTGKYAKGWKYEFHKTRREARTILFNEDYRLPHLLEYGHVTRNGTSRVMRATPAHEHIAPIEKELVETFEREVLDKL